MVYAETLWPAAELHSQGEHVNHKRIERVMGVHDIPAKQPNRFVRTTDSWHNHPVADNVLNQQYAVQAPNRVWTADITSIDTAEGWLYLVLVMDLFSRRIVGRRWTTRCRRAWSRTP